MSVIEAAADELRRLPLDGASAGWRPRQHGRGSYAHVEERCSKCRTLAGLARELTALETALDAASRPIAAARAAWVTAFAGE
jgi:hypothetical protein